MILKSIILFLQREIQEIKKGRFLGYMPVVFNDWYG
jgi:hypothetical protein